MQTERCMIDENLVGKNPLYIHRQWIIGLVLEFYKNTIELKCQDQERGWCAANDQGHPSRSHWADNYHPNLWLMNHTTMDHLLFSKISSVTISFTGTHPRKTENGHEASCMYDCTQQVWQTFLLRDWQRRVKESYESRSSLWFSLLPNAISDWN